MFIEGLEVKPCPFCQLTDKLSVSKKELSNDKCYKWSITCARCDLSMGVVMDDTYNEDKTIRDENDNFTFYNGRKALISNWNNRYGEPCSNRSSK